ncbi:MAG: hypothetical protein AMXMBFR46_15790 [Acidimicrobiia bacterium]
MSSSVLMIDWLGRGGIAQCTEAWAIELGGAGHAVTVVTRPDRELGAGRVPTIGAPPRRGRVRAHLAVARTATERIRDERPSVVVVHNYVLPPLEARVFDAARAVGARVVAVVHDDRLHTLGAGTRAGLRRRLREADVVVTHTRFVAEGVRRFTGRTDVTVLPVPGQIGLVSREPTPPRLPSGPLLWAGHFGVLRRRYKGGDLVEGLARAGVPGWGFVAAGAGAPRDAPGLVALPGYLSPEALLGVVSATDVTLAPYRRATQSGAVVLAHLLGSVPVASAVGGIPEQIEDGVDGVLLAPDAPAPAWRTALDDLADEERRKDMAVAGIARSWRDHEDFVRGIRRIVG